MGATTEFDANKVLRCNSATNWQLCNKLMILTSWKHGEFSREKHNYVLLFLLLTKYHGHQLFGRSSSEARS